MAESQNHHHHHHHHHHKHHKQDWATSFKSKSLSSIRLQKIIEKWLFRILCAIAILMFIAVIIVYRIN